MRLKKGDHMVIPRREIPPLLLQKLDYKLLAVSQNGELKLIDRAEYNEVPIQNDWIISDQLSLRINRWVISVSCDNTQTSLNCFTIDEIIPEIYQILESPIVMQNDDIDTAHLVIDDSTVASYRDQLHIIIPKKHVHEDREGKTTMLFNRLLYSYIFTTCNRYWENLNSTDI